MKSWVKMIATHRLWLLAPQIPTYLFPSYLYPQACYNPIKVLMIVQHALHFRGGEFASLVKLMVDLILWNKN